MGAVQVDSNIAWGFRLSGTLKMPKAQKASSTR